MVSSSSVSLGNKYIQKGLIFLGILFVVGVSVVSYHTDTSVIKHAVGKTLSKMKTLANQAIAGSTWGNYSDDALFFGSTTLPPEFDYQSQDDTKDKNSINQPLVNDLYQVIQKRFQERNGLKNKICKGASYNDMTVGKDLRGRFSPLCRGLIEWCRIPKVGSTYLQGLEKKVLRKMGTRDRSKFKPKSLLVVREPYSRIVSGYIGKIVTNPPWARNIGGKIVRRFRPRGSEKAKMCGHDVTFPEFLKYFVEAELTGWARNIHFVPMYKQCNPCAKTYDYIAHLETLKDDLTFAFQSVNVSVDMDFSDEESTMRGKARTIVSHRQKIAKCESMCSALGKVWWSFQARGLISTDIKFPLSYKECDAINGTEFADLAWDAHVQSTGRINKSKQRREAMVNLYLQASLADRMKVRDLLLKDFELYGYDSKPADLFPELYNKL